jgi:choline kinase
MPAAIILAAGRGRRLGDYTNEKPKCLLRVGDLTLLEHQLASLRLFGVSPVVVVAGYCADAVRERAGSRGTCLVNERHAETNSLYSLWLAREHARDGFVLLNADVLFDPEILERLLASPYPDALAVERRRRFDAEEMKVELDADRIRAVSKQLEPARAHAENVGVLKFSPSGARALLETAEALLAAGHEREFAPFAFNHLAPRHPLHAVAVDGLPWIEIDFVEDLLRARAEVWPAILARRSRARASALTPAVRAANPSMVPGN